MSPETVSPGPQVTAEWMPLGQRLPERGLVSGQELERALDLQRRLGGRLGGILVHSGAISENTLMQMLAGQLRLPSVEDDLRKPSEESIAAFLLSTPINTDWSVEEQLVVWEKGEQLLFAARGPLSPSIRKTLGYFYPERSIRAVPCHSQDLDGWLAYSLDLARQGVDQPAYGSEDIRYLRELAEGVPVAELVSDVMNQAMEKRSSDIHTKPREFDFRIRSRIDDVLHDQLSLPRERFATVVSRIKLISTIDIAERRLPQDECMSIRVSGMELNMRVSVLPGMHSESVVICLLPEEREGLRLDRPRMLPDHLQRMRVWVAEPHGIILVAGPTGSGKSTTLYGTLEEINDGVRKLINVEDSVEHQVPNITQVQVHTDIGLTFAAALHSILRQDPDVIMIGEIHDLETTEIAVQSSLTGHLVLSTLHTDDAVSTFTRLIDIGVKPFLVASPARGIQAQRLVCRLCAHCTEPREPILAAADLATTEMATTRLFPEQAAQWCMARGRGHCEGADYSGHVGIYELVDLSSKIHDLIVQRTSLEQVHRLAASQGQRNPREDGSIKAWLGMASLDEVHHVTSG